MREELKDALADHEYWKRWGFYLPRPKAISPPLQFRQKKNDPYSIKGRTDRGS